MYFPVNIFCRNSQAALTPVKYIGDKCINVLCCHFSYYSEKNICDQRNTKKETYLSCFENTVLHGREALVAKLWGNKFTTKKQRKVDASIPLMQLGLKSMGMMSLTWEWVFPSHLNTARNILFGPVLASFLSPWHKLELSGKGQTQLRKCL